MATDIFMHSVTTWYGSVSRAAYCSKFS